MKMFRTILAAVALLALTIEATAQTIGDFTFTTPGVYTNNVRVDPGSSVVDLSAKRDTLHLYLTAAGLVAGKGTGTLTWMMSASPDGALWTSTNDTKYHIAFTLNGSTNKTVLTNINVDGMRFLKVAALHSTDTETAVTNVAAVYYQK